MPDNQLNPPETFRSGYIVLIGRPNVGKSTLFNALVGERLSIITPKPQTTRNNILGIITTPDYQMLFLDTPGLLDPRYRLQEAMRKQIQDALPDADILLGIVDASDFQTTFDDGVREIFTGTGAPLILALNKTDASTPEETRRQVHTLREQTSARSVLPVSALTGAGLPDLKTTLEQTLPPGPQFYPEDVLTEHPERFFVAEIIREELFTQLRQEIPYSLAVRIEEFREDRPKVYIRADIIVERHSQKGIVIGSKGRTLKSVGRKSRVKVEEFLDRPVYLDLHVKVYENWRKKDTLLRGLGYLT